MTTDYRALCAELADMLEANIQLPAELETESLILLARARAALSNQLDFHEPTLQQVADLCSQFGFTCAGEADLACLRAVLREGFSRWGNHSADASKMVGQPTPPAEGEVAELVAWLRNMANAGLGGLDELNAARAADLLEQRHPVPVPVAERLPGPGDCDGEGRCWLFSKVEKEWRLIDAGNPGVPHLKYCFSHWLSATALPLPSGEVQP